MQALRSTVMAGLWACVGSTSAWAAEGGPGDAPPPPPGHVPAGPPPGGPGAGGPGPGAGERAMAEFFRKLDSNGNGLLEESEFLAFDRLGRVPEDKRREIFRRLDKNGDGGIHPSELAGMHEGMGGRGGRLPRLDDLDRDHSGGISLEEFRQGGLVSKLPPERQQELFRRMDRDGDGQLTPRDRPPPGEGPRGGPWGPRSLAGLDKDRSGGVSFEEYAQAEWVRNLPPERQREMFGKMDRDGDGQLTDKDGRGGPGDGERGPGRPGGPEGRKDGDSGGPGEGPKGPPPGWGGFGPKAFDRDGDGLLSFEEFRALPMVKDLGEAEQREKFGALDKNGDLKLQPEELPGPRRGESGRPERGRGPGGERREEAPAVPPPAVPPPPGDGPQDGSR